MGRLSGSGSDGSGNGENEVECDGDSKLYNQNRSSMYPSWFHLVKKIPDNSKCPLWWSWKT